MLIKPIKNVVHFFLLICSFLFLFTTAVCAAEQPDFKLLTGTWIRANGGYVLRVQNINSDGLVSAEYLNPKAINIAEANVSEWKGLNKLFIKLQDEGYPGSTYTLYYYADKDALAGFYYQAEMKQTYEVIFMRDQKQ